MALCSIVNSHLVRKSLDFSLCQYKTDVLGIWEVPRNLALILAWWSCTYIQIFFFLFEEERFWETHTRRLGSFKWFFITWYSAICEYHGQIRMIINATKHLLFLFVFPFRKATDPYMVCSWSRLFFTSNSTPKQGLTSVPPGKFSTVLVNRYVDMAYADVLYTILLRK